MAAAINSPVPAAETNLPSIEAVRPIDVQNEVRTAGEAFNEVTLWDGKITADSIESDIILLSQPIEVEAAEVETAEAAKAPETSKAKYVSVEAEVREYFADIPVMIEVAKCESRFRHSDTAGEILRGVVNNLDRGVMQINEGYHRETSKKLGYDILTLEGNLAYARYLYQKQGTRPWKSSSPCWGKTPAAQMAQI